MSWGTVSSEAIVPRHPESLTGSPAGSGLLDAPTSASVLAVAAEVGARVADPARVAEAVAAAARQTAHPASVHWRDHAVGQGHAGLALLFGALDHHDPDQGWDRTAHQHLTRAARAAEALPRPPAGLFAGLAGLGLVAISLAGDGTRYRRLLATVDQALVARVPALTATARTPGGLAVRELDLISGLSGIGAYLLLRPEAPGVAGALRAVLGTLVALTGSDPSGPRWRTPPDRLSPEERARYPDGYLNCGLAHGIPGPLAVLSLALRSGVDLPGLPDAVARTAAWLAAHGTDDPSGPTWPNAVPLPGPSGATAPVPAGPARAAWCYGGPGVAAALRLAGAALGPAGAGYHDLAVAALARPVGEGGPGSPTFCHGRAGLLAVTSTFARATGDDRFQTAAAGLAAGLLAGFDPASPLGYRDVETGGRLIDQPGLLTGAPGAALALLGAASPAEPTWARLFLLA
jgi:lantibiotic biosynthesis protein